MEAVAEIFNKRSPPIEDDSWVSHRKVIVLEPISHNTEPVSAIPSIKSYSCFRPYNFNRVAMKRLPCCCPACLTMTSICTNQQMAGWFDDPETGQFKVQYLVEPTEPTPIRVSLPARSRHSLEVTVNPKHLRDAMQQAKAERRARAVLPPRKRPKRDFANPVVSAQTRKYHAGHKADKKRYKTEEKETNWSPTRQAAAGSFLFAKQPPSPLKKVKPPTPATPAQPMPPRPMEPAVTTLQAPQKRRGPKKKKSKKKRGPGRPARVLTRKKQEERRKKK